MNYFKEIDNLIPFYFNKYHIPSSIGINGPRYSIIGRKSLNKINDGPGPGNYDVKFEIL